MCCRSSLLRSSCEKQAYLRRCSREHQTVAIKPALPIRSCCFHYSVTLRQIFFDIFRHFSLPEKEDSYGHLNMKVIIDADYVHVKRFCKDFEIKELGKYYDLHVKSDILLLAGVFGTFEICIMKYMNLILQNFFQHLD